MGLPNETSPFALGAAGAPYEIEQSLRFDGSSYFSRTYSSAGNRKTFTVSWWVKRATGQTSTYNDQYMFSAYDGGGSQFVLAFYGSGLADSVTEFSNDQGYSGAGSGYTYTNSKYRDESAWYHIVYVADYSNATAADRRRIYFNGERVTSFRLENPYVDADSSWNYAGAHYIGRLATGTSNNFSGYMAEVNVVDGQALTHEDFGEFDYNGVWRPIEYTGTYSGNSFYLKFDPSATNGIGHDHSGLGNHFTATNFNTSGTGTDVMIDTPTTNYCTWNPLGFRNDNVSAKPLYYYGNLRARLSATTVGQLSVGTIQAESGHYYVEFTIDNGGPTYSNVGIAANSQRLEAHYKYYRNGQSGLNGTTASYGDTWATGDIIGCRFDLDGGEIEFYKNGTSQGVLSTSFDTTYGSHFGPLVGGDNETTVTLNAGQRAFSYTIPTGASTLCSANLPAPSIKDGSEYFNTVLYTGNGSTQTISGVGFQPDWVWLKSRSNSYNNYVFDVIRGTGEQLYTNLDNEEFTSSGTLTSFDTDGFSLGNSANADINNSSATFVAWNWLAGGSGSSNTAGTITSTVSANPSAGFSIVSYTSPNNSADQTVGHGLGVKPSFIIVKNRDLSYNWDIYHSSLGYNASLIFTTAATRSGAFGAEPTSTVFTTKTGYTHNSTNRYVAYCFAEIESYSKFGSFVGNGNADGPFVFCGFRPAYVWLKGSTFVSNWNAYDSARSEYNAADDLLRLNSNAAEVSDYSLAAIDLLSNGFKIRTSSGDWNSSGQTFIFCAFAEAPTNNLFGGQANAR